MVRDLVLLCTCCQTTKRVTMEVTVHSTQVDGEKEFKPSASVWAHCPKCNAKMYQADEELVSALMMLNGAGYATAFHCSNAHFDENNDIHKDDMKYPFECAKFTRGPHIIIEGMDEKQIEALMFMGKQYADGYSVDTKLQVEVEREVHTVKKLLGKPETKRDRIEIMVMCADVTQESMKEACCILTEFIDKWLRSTNDGELPTGRGGRLSRIANTCWFS